MHFDDGVEEPLGEPSLVAEGIKPLAELAALPGEWDPELETAQRWARRPVGLPPEFGSSAQASSSVRSGPELEPQRPPMPPGAVSRTQAALIRAKARAERTAASSGCRRQS